MIFVLEKIVEGKKDPANARTMWNMQRRLKYSKKCRAVVSISTFVSHLVISIITAFLSSFRGSPRTTHPRMAVGAWDSVKNPFCIGCVYG